jgi:hypothetical protein
MDQVSIKYTNIIHCKTLQNLPNFFIIWKQTIWQPCLYRYMYSKHASMQSLRTENNRCDVLIELNVPKDISQRAFKQANPTQLENSQT